MSVSQGSDSIHDLRGAAHRNLMAGIGFTVGGLSMVGVPFDSRICFKIIFCFCYNIFSSKNGNYIADIGS